jgi:hypothetical protein
MATFNKFNAFVESMAEAKHNLQTDTLKVMLTSVAPTSANSVKADLTEIAAGNGYAAGGNSSTVTSSAQTGGVYKLVLADPATWTSVTLYFTMTPLPLMTLSDTGTTVQLLL